jgi:hypothetical protein
MAVDNFNVYKIENFNPLQTSKNVIGKKKEPPKIRQLFPSLIFIAIYLVDFTNLC